MSSFIEWLILPAALLGGLILFALFAMFISGASYENKKSARLSRLESEHYNRSQAETEELVRALHARDFDTYDRKKAEHKQAWKRRVDEIVKTASPVDDATWEELEKGINPYKRRK